MYEKLVCGFILVHFILTQAQYQVPPVKLEAIKPKGIRVSIPDSDKVEFFGFHGKINKEIGNVEEGEFFGEVKSSQDGYWVYYNPNIELKHGDTVYYWVFIQRDRLGYRKDNEKWEVKELVSLSSLVQQCSSTQTTIDGGKSSCSGRLIFEDTFTSNSVNSEKWQVEHRIPTYVPPDHEFSSYQDSDDTRFIRDSRLFLKPIVENSIRGELNLGKRCTGKTEVECSFKHYAVSFLPPVKSARISSKFSFKYGKVEIRAKLPAGDWIYPQLYLEPVQKKYGNDSGKMWIAYSRGNDRLTGTSGQDIGSRWLFGGAVLDPFEPKRSAGVKSTSSNTPFNQDFHTFTLLWEPSKITVGVDSDVYGIIGGDSSYTELVGGEKPWNNQGAPFDQEFYISLGVGIGGVNDFPDNYKSGISNKPWGNRKADLLKSFFDSRNTWLKTWVGDAVALQIESIKVYAL